MEMPLTDRDQIVTLAKRYETLPSNVQRLYALKNPPKKWVPPCLNLNVPERDKCVSATQLCAVTADDWLGTHLQGTAKRGYLTRSELKKIARWKFPGPKPRMLIQENSKCDVREISRASFTARSERLRIGALLV